MKYIYLLTLLCNYCYCQDTTNAYQGEQEIQETLHGSKSSTQEVNIGGKLVPVTKNGGYTDLRPLNNNVDYSVDSNINSNSKKENIPGFNPYDEVWDSVHYDNESNNPVPSDTYHDYTDWEGILVTSGIILFLVGAGIFLYKLLK